MTNPFKKPVGNKTLVNIKLPKGNTIRISELIKLNPGRGRQTFHHRINEMIKAGYVTRAGRGTYNITNRVGVEEMCNGASSRTSVTSNMSTLDKTLFWLSCTVIASVITWVIYRLFLNPHR